MEETKKRKDNDFVIAFLRQLSLYVVKILAKTPITPNQVTIFSFVIFVPVIFYFLMKGEYLYNLIALALIAVTIILDLCDGALARLKGVSSGYGAFLDASLDKIFQFLIIVSITIGVFNVTSEVGWLIWGLAMLASQAMADQMGSLYDYGFGFNAYTGSVSFMEKLSGQKLSPLDSFLKNIIVPSKSSYIFLFTARYWLVLGIIFNHLELFLIIFTVAISIRWLTMYFLYLRILAGGVSKSTVVNYLTDLRANQNNS